MSLRPVVSGMYQLDIVIETTLLSTHYPGVNCTEVMKRIIPVQVKGCYIERTYLIGSMFF